MINRLAHHFCISQSCRLFLFAGQGTQEVGMLDSLPQQTQEIIGRASRLLGIDFRQIATTDKDKKINQTEITQPLLMLSHYLYFRAQGYHSSLASDDWMIGHSLGEFSALVNAGSLSLEEGLKLVHLRGSLMKKHTASPHGMLIVKYKPEKQEEIYDEVAKANLEVACINTKTSIIVAGPKSALQPLAKTLRGHQAAALTLPVSTAFHCKMLESMKDQFRQALEKVRFEPPQCKILRNYDCNLYKNEEDIRQGLLLQLTNTVRFAQSVQKVPLQSQVIEVGHKPWISKFAEEVRRSCFLQSLI